MLLFPPEQVHLILSGHKTQARWLWSKSRVQVGGLQKLYTRHPLLGGKPFAMARVTGVREELLSMISDDDVLAEGYATRKAFFEAFRRIHRIRGPLDLVCVFVVDFRVLANMTAHPVARGHHAEAAAT